MTKLTADTITDEQIEAAHRERLISVVIRDLALTPDTSGTIRPYYRAAVAEILNARAAAEECADCGARHAGKGHTHGGVS